LVRCSALFPVLTALSVFGFVLMNGLWRLRLFLRQAGNYTWMTYKEVYDTVLKVGAAIRSCGVGKVRGRNVDFAYSD
jgi:hypothetical protein